MPLKETDYQISRGIEKLQYRRGVKINDKATALCVVLVKNYKKGFFSIETKWTAEQITSIAMDDKATIKTLGELMLKASEDGAQWQQEWHENKPKDESNPEIFGEEGASDGDGKMAMGFE